MTSALSAWQRRIADHDAQTLRARGNGPGYEDLYANIASGFREDPHRTGDPVVDALASWLTPDTTVLDVGGGAGRYALPLALRCRHVTVVDPSPSMLSQLRESAAEARIENVSSIEATWEEAKVEPADIVLCANVVYGVADIRPFIAALSEYAARRVAILVYMDHPMFMISSIWRAVHGEERIQLPALPELLAVLWEMDIFPNVEMLPPRDQRALPNRDIALQMAQHLVYVQPGTDADSRLQAALTDQLVQTESGVTLRDLSYRPQGLIWWRTE